jgi:hypothetical protein
MWQSSRVRLHRVAVPCGSTVWQFSVIPPLTVVVRLHGQILPYVSPLWLDSTVCQTSVVIPHHVSVLCGETPLFGSLLWPDSTMGRFSMIILLPEWQSSVTWLHRVAVRFFCGQTPPCGSPLWSDPSVWQTSSVRLHRVWVFCGQTPHVSVLSDQWSVSTVLQEPLSDFTVCTVRWRDPQRNQLNIIQGPCAVGSRAFLLKKQKQILPGAKWTHWLETIFTYIPFSESWGSLGSASGGTRVCCRKTDSLQRNWTSHIYSTSMHVHVQRIQDFTVYNWGNFSVSHTIHTYKNSQLANSTYTVVDDRQSIPIRGGHQKCLSL